MAQGIIEGYEDLRNGSKKRQEERTLVGGRRGNEAEQSKGVANKSRGKRHPRSPDRQATL